MIPAQAPYKNNLQLRAYHYISGTTEDIIKHSWKLATSDHSNENRCKLSRQSERVASRSARAATTFEVEVRLTLEAASAVPPGAEQRLTLPIAPEPSVERNPSSGTKRPIVMAAAMFASHARKKRCWLAPRSAHDRFSSPAFSYLRTLFICSHRPCFCASICDLNFLAMSIEGPL